MSNLTKKQKQVFDFINTYISENGISPTIEEIRKKLKLKAVSTIHEHINSLKAKGYLSKSENSARSLSLRKEIKSIVEIPILGRIAAGYPIEAIENIEDTISIVNPNIKTSEGYYALRVVGESMIDEGIFDGDIVVIKKQSVAENGQTVVAIIDDNEATLKKLYREKARYRLEARNPNMPSLFRTDVEVRGVVVQVISNITDKPEKIVSKKTKHGFKTIDLFAGVGGIRLGFENAGFKTVFANDFEPQC
ncbi:MAG: transcriptional repressor LexA, partial [Oligoflexales bacterium]|nr:transcriptional repressor LexA [Oligoflexales bacterium]